LTDSERPVALVTGASSGIGAATVRALAAAGFATVAAARRLGRCQELAEEVGGVARRLDVTDAASVAALAESLLRVDLIVHSAGGALGLNPVAEADERQWEEMYESNVMGVMRVTKALLPALRRSPHPHLIVIGSVAGVEVYPAGGGYTAAKHAVHAIAQTLRLELLDDGIRVTEIAPGLVETEFSLIRFGGDERRAKDVYRGLEPLSAGDVADAIAFVATRPPHVDIDYLAIKPTAQATATIVHRDAGAEAPAAQRRLGHGRDQTRTAIQPYPSQGRTAEAFAAHVDRGKVRALEAIGVEIVIGAREGPRFRDAYTGRWYWNCHCNGGVFNLGHRHPGVIEAVREGLDHLDVGNHHLVSGWRARLAEQLYESTGGRLSHAVFTPSGTESVDLALRLARATTGRPKVIAALGGYHGLSGFALAASDPRWFEPFGFSPKGFVHVPFNEIDAIRREIDSETAAVILEAIPATLGFPAPAPGYLREVAAAAHAGGALLILDEVQTGLGRTGSHWYFQQQDVEPDMLITGKGLGGGIYPVSATLVSEELESFFESHPFAYVSTFGGAEIGCVAAGAVMDEISMPGFLERVEQLGARFERAFAGMPFELRRFGLTMGLKFDHEQGGVVAAKKLIDSGVFAVFAEHDHSVTQFKPPLIVTEADVDEIAGTVRAALS
jgi:putrescine aminotransferase